MLPKDEIFEDSSFVTLLAHFCYLILEGRTPEEVRPFFFNGESLVALEKNCGGDQTHCMSVDK